jgi:general secretion pathway protein N
VSPTSSFRSRFGAPRRAAEARPDARPRHWAWAGAALGLLVALPMTLPAAWMAGLVSRATDGRLQLAEAEGPWWNGSALPVLTGGPGSRDASVLPSRLHWRVGLHWNGLSLTLSQPCCAAAPSRCAGRPAGASSGSAWTPPAANCWASGRPVG